MGVTRTFYANLNVQGTEITVFVHVAHDLMHPKASSVEGKMELAMTRMRTRKRDAAAIAAAAFFYEMRRVVCN